MVFEMDYNEILEHVQINNMVLADGTNGVVSGLDVSERGAGANMSVDVATGSCIIASTSYTESSIVNLVISAAHATLTRKDLVIYDAATSNPLVITGTPAATPVPPDITAGDILLAIVNVAVSPTTITNSDIVDCIVEISDTGTIMNNPATADLDMADYGLTGLDQLRAYDFNGIQIFDHNGTSCLRLATNSASIDVTGGNFDMNNFRVRSTSDPVLAQDAATKNWIETSAVAYGAGKVDGCDAGVSAADVFKIPADTTGTMYQKSSGSLAALSPGTSGYQLTSAGFGNALTWAAASDLIFSDTHCPKCGKEFQDGDDLILHVIGHNEVGDILTIPMHLACANAPKKRVMLKRAIMDDHYILDDATGEVVIQRVPRMRERLVTRHKLKEGYIINDVTGKVHKLNHGGTMQKTEQALSNSIEEIEETISEQEYEEVEYTI